MGASPKRTYPAVQDPRSLVGWARFFLLVLLLLCGMLFSAAPSATLHAIHAKLRVRADGGGGDTSTPSSPYAWSPSPRFLPLCGDADPSTFLWPPRNASTGEVGGDVPASASSKHVVHLTRPPAWSTMKWAASQHDPISNALIDYPLTSAMLHRSHHPAVGPRAASSECAWGRVRRALGDGKHVRFVVLGGSMTAGCECMPYDSHVPKMDEDLQSLHDCAWPSHIAPWLQRVRPEWRFSLHNDALAGMSADAYAARTSIRNHQWQNEETYQAAVRLAKSTPRAGASGVGAPPGDDERVDVFILDYTQNPSPIDSLISRAIRNPTYAWDNDPAGRSPPAVLVVNTFSICPHFGAKSDGELQVCGNYCSGKERREFKSKHDLVDYCSYMYEYHKTHVDDAEFFGLPRASYVHAVWPEQSHPPENLTSFWTRGGTSPSHPRRVSHELVADVVKYSLASLLRVHPPGGGCGGSYELNGHDDDAAACAAAENLPPITDGESNLCATRPAGTSRFSWEAGSDALREAAVTTTPADIRNGSAPSWWAWQPAKVGRPPMWVGTVPPPGHKHTVPSDGGLASRPRHTLLSFQVSLNATLPRLELQFRRSWRGHSNASLWIQGPGCPDAPLAVLRGAWGNRYTVPTLQAWDADIDSARGRGTPKEENSPVIKWPCELTEVNEEMRRKKSVEYTVTLELDSGVEGVWSMHAVAGC